MIPFTPYKGAFKCAVNLLASAKQPLGLFLSNDSAFKILKLIDFALAKNTTLLQKTMLVIRHIIEKSSTGD